MVATSIARRRPRGDVSPDQRHRPNREGSPVAVSDGLRRRRSATVQRPDVKNGPQKGRRKAVLTVGWIIVLIGVLAVHWADGRPQAF
jgi:hypothetical protein